MRLQSRLLSNSIPAYQKGAHNTSFLASTLQAASRTPLSKPISIIRPFGFKSPILLNHKSSETYSLKKLWTQLFDEEARIQRQKKLNNELTHSYTFETASFANTKGKIFTPPKSYFKKDKAYFFPGFVGTNLKDQVQSFYEKLEGKVSIVRLYYTESGENITSSYFETPDGNLLTSKYEAFVKEYPKTQIIDINIPQSWLKGYLVKLGLRSIMKSLPGERASNYFLVPHQLFDFEVREKLNCNISPSGYLYLLDDEGHIRWATSGSGDRKEKDQLWKYVRGLEKELNNESVHT